LIVTVGFKINGTVDFGTVDFKINGTVDFKIDGTVDFKSTVPLL